MGSYERYFLKNESYACLILNCAVTSSSV